MKIKPALLLFSAILLIYSSIFALNNEKIHPALQDEISSLGQEYHTVLIRLADRHNKFTLNKKLGLDTYSRQAAHYLAITELKSHARETQQDLLEFLGRQVKNKNVRFYKSYWIDNLIRAEVSLEVLDQLSEFDEVETIFPDVRVTTIEPLDYPVSKVYTPGELPDHLTVIGADSMWKLGYTGEGTLAATFDTGIEGTHPALSGSYRGNFGYSHEQCWFDPYVNDTFPHTIRQVPSQYRFHGTGTLSLIVGKDDATGDTLGVAFGAHWISAAVIDIPQVNYILDAFEWIVDPDGDPNTIEDVPDALSHSWGYDNDILGCSDIFYTAIDNVEALGTVVVFSAGNDGSSYRSLRNPANRASSPYNSFAVGMTRLEGDEILVDLGSSRGPSECNTDIIKPNVVAMGRNVMIADSSGYGFNSGTSFSAPQVAGAVCLLRQYNPNAPVDSIKKALMLSATDIDEPGPDSAAGYGLINVPASLEYLDPNNQPDVFINSVTMPMIQPGDTVDVALTLKNDGPGVLSVTGIMRGSDSDVDLIDSSATFGDIALNGSADNIADPYRIYFDEDVLEGTDITIDLLVTASGGYEKIIPVHFLVGNRQDRSLYTHDAGAFLFTISNFGAYGLDALSLTDLGGQGFVFPKDSESSLFEMGLLISAGDSNHVSNAVRNQIGVADEHFRVAPAGNLQEVVPTDTSIAEQTISKFNDLNAPMPIGIEVMQESFAFDNHTNDQFMIFMYVLENISDSNITDLYASIFADWDFYTTTGGLVDNAGYDAASGTGYMMHALQTDYRGITVLNDEGVYSYRIIPGQDWLYNGFSKSEKWMFISEDSISEAALTINDYTHMITTGPFALAPGDVDTAAFAVIAAESQFDLLDFYAQNAINQYNNLPTQQDTVKPGFSINMLTNPVLHFEADFYAYATEELKEEPVMTVEGPLGAVTYTMDDLPNRDAVAYFQSLRIDQDGDYSITVCGEDLALNEGCEILDLSAALLKGAGFARLQSADGLIGASIKSDDDFAKGMLLLVENNEVDISSDYQAVKKFGLKKSAGLDQANTQLEIHADKLNFDYRQAVLLHGTNLDRVELQYDQARRVLIADGVDAGDFVLAKSENSSEIESVPRQFALYQNKPNPFNPYTEIAFEIPKDAHVNLSVYNILGQKVTTLIDEHLGAGTHSTTWDALNSSGDNVASGFYFYKLTAGDLSDVKRMLLLK